MAKTSPTSTHDPAVTPKPHPIRSFLVLVFRLLLLGIGGGFAALLGIAIAQFRPASAPSEPLAARLFRQSTQILQQTQRGSPVSTDPQTAETPTTTPASPSAIVTADADALTFTLPSDALFETNQTALRPDAQSILNGIQQDLQRYPGAVVRIASHTASATPPDASNAARDRSRSLAQAQTIETYLSDTLGDRYHWVSIGYGSTRPLVPNDSPLNQQSNRRIEITVEP
ncbi:OmpA family protein [Oscillatoria sp. FACHB-1407]|uniref:OmpA family protein n=1 Tax=Oscillatoria sp. FACHB-1407 TaxID=2692847 RepID=UPI0016820208|nr:OmpA family protein [Oscillatoria sp. FACHB-1407]MBD2464630.1 OmpA family protein [Oscillatoria sp. FACHB-1407]